MKRPTGYLAAFYFAAALFAAPAGADERGKLDVIVLLNGDHVTGEIQSLAYGAAGARRRHTVSSASRSTATAAGSASLPGAQKRSRESRTYQLERSSTTKRIVAFTPAVIW